MQEKIGFIGLGAMGAPMVQRLLHAGHRVVVHDLDAGGGR
jgi:3-hydroxyisobutyrate dehydrogenase-like beta-hydroxyacid dehydrogenase